LNHPHLWDDTMSSGFQDVRDERGEALNVTSGYRCPRWNKHIEGETDSKHIQGDAFDYDEWSTGENWEVAQEAKAVTISRLKILLYPQTGYTPPQGYKKYRTLYWLETHGYNATNLPKATEPEISVDWTEYNHGHITTD